MVTRLMTRPPPLPEPYEATRLLLGHPGHERWAGRDRRLGRRICVDLWTALSAGERARLVTSARGWARLGHAAVVPVYVVEERDGEVVVVRRMVDGRPLQAGRVPASRLGPALLPVADALDSAHGLGLVHGRLRAGALQLVGPMTAILTELGLGHSPVDAARDRRDFVNLLLELLEPGRDSESRSVLEAALGGESRGCRALLEAAGMIEPDAFSASGSYAAIPSDQREDADGEGPIEVVVVEDVLTDFLLLERHLSGRGRRVRLRHLEQLVELEAALRMGADVVLLDLSLPGSEGAETVRGVVEQCSGTPVVVLTEEADEDAAVRLVRAGAQDVVNKSEASAPALRRAITFAIERSRWVYRSASSVGAQPTSR